MVSRRESGGFSMARAGDLAFDPQLMKVGALLVRHERLSHGNEVLYAGDRVEMSSLRGHDAFMRTVGLTDEEVFFVKEFPDVVGTHGFLYF